MSFALETTDDSTTVRVRGVENIKPLLDTFHAHGYNELDTARFYCHGDTETVLGQAPTEQFKISTKVWPTVPKAHGSELLKKTFRESLAALNGKKVDIFYLHAPDYTTPFEETIKAVDELYREGLFERFGLSNFAAWQVTLIHELCKQNGYVVPTVYQGMYNAFTRDVVRELLPCLKALNIAFYGFNPIAGGLLSGKIDFDKVDETKGGPFDTAVSMIYRERYLNTLTVDAVKKMEKVCKEHSLTLIESALRWMSHHAGLGPQDGIIIGASSVGHLEANLKDLEKGPLPKGVVEAYDEAWEHVKVACASYFKTQQSVGSLNAK
ncbi:Aldo/keto reductase [Gamsiella multidivaricata]|uniref:Aldo/keto reductase n=1 Tax=Gamsiella multidivaricata TaxID=101098 RepID=UPI002220A607|nr:Aldo/keto reductase [Gamsiella multidivaricata]KAI7817008.1 Aldo/keto reductase [Gamsiella multidivaricata]